MTATHVIEAQLVSSLAARLGCRRGGDTADRRDPGGLLDALTEDTALEPRTAATVNVVDGTAAR